MRLTSDALVLPPEELATRRLRIILLAAIALSFAGQLAIAYEFVNAWLSLHGPLKWIFAPLMAGNLVYALWLARATLRSNALVPFSWRALWLALMFAGLGLIAFDGLPGHHAALTYFCAAVLVIVNGFTDKPRQTAVPEPEPSPHE